MSTPVEEMTMQLLREEFRQLGQEIEVRANRRKDIDNEMNRRKRRAAARARIQGLSPREREALREALCSPE